MKKKKSDSTKLRYAQSKLKNALLCLDRISDIPVHGPGLSIVYFSEQLQHAVHDARETAKCLRRKP